ncbi:hypothetical protein TI05_08415 [Achromatium sp. WMS3]|nr:hypothetical protein TI05_08415 [Achromatium sp. WMS3]
MKTFSDSYVIQTLGVLACNNFHGKATIVIANLTLEFWFKKGLLYHVYSPNKETFLAFKQHTWAIKGQLELEPELETNSSMEACQIFERIFMDRYPPIIHDNSLLRYVTIKQGRMRFLNNCQLFNTALEFLKIVATQEWDINKLQDQYLQTSQNIQSFFFSLALGLIQADYSYNLLPVLRRYTNKVTEAKRNREGPRITNAYVDNINQQYKKQWQNSDIVPGTISTELVCYGTTPYRYWLEVIYDGAAGIGQPRQHHHSLRRAFASLDEDDQILLRLLSEPHLVTS